MIVSKTPTRLSFFSGGSDLPAFYHKEAGAALNVTINKYLYVMVHRTHNTGIRLKFADTDHVDAIDKINHQITKATLTYYYGEKNLDGWEIASISDVPYHGCGLGTSSAFTVGLVNCLWKTGAKLGAMHLANEACRIEIECCNNPVGKQDQYSTACGGLNLFRFNTNGTVGLKPIVLSRFDLETFEEKLVLIFSGLTRDGNVILKSQSNAMLNDEKFKQVQKNRDKAFEAEKYIIEGDYDSFGHLLGESWEDKKKISQNITDPYLDHIYETAMLSGAYGGKVLGAGGGGFFLFYVPNHEVRMKLIKKVTEVSDKIVEVPFRITTEGSKIVYTDRRE